MIAIEMFNTMTAEEIADTIVKKIDSFKDGVPYRDYGLYPWKRVRGIV